MTGPMFYTREQAAERANVSPSYITEAVNAGRLKAKKTGENGGGKYLIHPQALEDWFAGLVDA